MAKHENHTPLGAFKVRGGLACVEALAREQPDVRHVMSATRGNHGQSIGVAVARRGLAAEKNAAMRALGVQLVEHGDDVQAASEHAAVLADGMACRTPVPESVRCSFEKPTTCSP